MLHVWLRVAVLEPHYIIEKDVQNVDELLTWVESLCPKNPKKCMCLCRDGGMGFSGEDDIATHIRDKREVQLELRRQVGESANCKPVGEMRRHPRALYCVEFVQSQPWGKDGEATILEDDEDTCKDDDVKDNEADNASAASPSRTARKTPKTKERYSSPPGFFRRKARETAPDNVPDADPTVVDWVSLGIETEPWPVIHVRGRETLVSLMNHDVAEALRFFVSGRVEPSLRDEDENSLLHWAAFHGLQEMAKKLIEYQASLNDWNINGETPLLVACRCEHWDVAKHLIKVKAAPDPYAEDDCVDGGTPLIWACRHNNIGLVHLLCRARANLEIKDADGMTAMHMSASRGFTEITNMLLRYGGAVDTRRTDNATPIQLASRFGQCEDLNVLLDAFPKPNPADITI